MSEPSVCCICLTADRQAFTDRAVRCFSTQTYPNADLLIYDTGVVPYELGCVQRCPNVTIAHCPGSRGHAIGALRNQAIELVSNADIIAHWDSDDWSDSVRIAAQVKDLDGANVWVTGFQNALFLDTRVAVTKAWEYDCNKSGLGKVIGASLCYRREAWEACHFNDAKHTGEDAEWARQFKVLPTDGYRIVSSQSIAPGPMLIAEVHGANTSGVYSVFDNHQPAFQPEWRLAPEWDAYCRERLYP